MVPSFAAAAWSISLLLLTFVLATSVLARPAGEATEIVGGGRNPDGYASPKTVTPSSGLSTQSGRGGTPNIGGNNRRSRIGTRQTEAGRRRPTTPRSADVVTRRQFNERDVQTAAEAVAYTPEGSVDVTGYDQLGSAVDIRGYDVTYHGVFRDGLRQTAADLSVPRIEPYGVETLAVLRGPAAGIFGLNAPAGILALTTKQPKFEPFGEVQVQAGNYSRYQGNFDVGGPVEGSDGTMAYRLTGLVREANTYLPGATDDRTFIAPAFTWKPDEDTTLTVLAEYMHTRLPSNPSYYYFPGYVVSRLYQGTPHVGAVEQDQFRVGYAFEHRFSPDLIVRQNLRYAGTGVDFNALRFYPGTVDAARRTGEGYVFASREHLRSLAVDSQVEGRVEYGPVQHTLVGGVRYIHFDFERRSGSIRNNDIQLDRLDDANYLPRLSYPDRVRQSEDLAGIYLQDQAKWGRFVLTLAGRYDWLSSDTAADAAVGPLPPSILPRQSQKDAAFTYRVGLNYLLTSDIVPYASYATTFVPQPGIGNGNPFPAARGDQVEAGVKVAIPDWNITSSIVGFDVTQTSNSDRNLNTVFFQLPVGSVDARGFEAEMTANVTPNASLTLAYRHLDFRFTRQIVTTTDSSGRAVVNRDVSGNLVGGTPGNTFSAFATYLFPTSSPLSGLTVGGGLRFAGSSYIDDLNTVRNPTVSLFDVVVAYDLAALDPKYKGFRAQINAFNILDRNYTYCQNLFCYRGAPASVIGSLAYRW